MDVFHVSGDGAVERREISKKDLVDSFDMHARDLRPVFFARQLFTISVRGNAIIVNLDELKAIIGADGAYFLKTENERRIRGFLEILSKKLLNKEEDMYIPFEFLVLEAGFEFMFEKFESHFNALEKKIVRLLSEITEQPTQLNFEQLLILKKEISRLGKSVQEVQNALNELLEDTKEMQAMIISPHIHHDFGEEDVESILENTLEQVMEIAHKILERKENIDDTQEILTLKMASIRNTIIQFDLITSIGTGILGFGTLIAGFYGMNLSSHLEESVVAFYTVTGIVILFSVIAFWWFFRILKKKKIWSQETSTLS